MCKHQLVAHEDSSNQRCLTFGDSVGNEVVSVTGIKETATRMAARDGASESHALMNRLQIQAALNG